MIIVGSGLCGLSIASRARKNGESACTVLEKSKGVGGRMATRRTDHAKFDHGAQFIRARPESNELRSRWQESRLLSSWFEKDGISHFSGRDGMTSLAKDLARDATVKLDHRVTHIERMGSGWRVYVHNQPSLETELIILTAPLPQCLEILKTSHIAFDEALSKITYEKALVALFENVRSTSDLLNAYGYVEPIESEIFSVADQRAKAISTARAWTVTMGPVFSEANFEGDEAETLDQIVKAMQKFDASFEFENRQLKKWRYCRPTSRYAKPFETVAPGVLLAGDAFGGASLNGAIRSAVAVCKALEQTP